MAKAQRPFCGAGQVSVDDQSRCTTHEPVKPVSPHSKNLFPFIPATSSSYATIDPDIPDAGGDDPSDDTEEGQEEFAAKMQPGPFTPSKEDRDNHSGTGHAVYRAWCGPCVQGRGRCQPHRSSDHSADAYPVLSFDYGFLGSRDEGDGISPVLVMRDRKSQTPLWYLLPKKGCDFPTFENFLTMASQDIRRLGYKKVLFRSDGKIPFYLC